MEKQLTSSSCPEQAENCSFVHSPDKTSHSMTAMTHPTHPISAPWPRRCPLRLRLRCRAPHCLLFVIYSPISDGNIRPLTPPPCWLSTNVHGCHRVIYMKQLSIKLGKYTWCVILLLWSSTIYLPSLSGTALLLVRTIWRICDYLSSGYFFFLLI